MTSYLKNFFGGSKSGKKEIVQDDEEYPKEELEIEFEEEDDIENMFGEKVYENEKWSLHVADAREFIKMKNWAYNRKMDESHVQNLVSQLKEDHDLIGTFKVVVEKNNHKHSRVIDGQHRAEALHRIMNINTKFNMEIKIEAYYVHDIDGPEAWDLFNKANNVLNVKEDDKSTSASSFVVTKLAKEFPLGIYDKKKNNVFPKIDKKELFERLKQSDIFEYKTKDEVYDLIISKNIEWSKINVKEYTSALSTKKRERIEMGYKKTKDSGFYLGLYVTNSQFSWLQELEISTKFFNNSSTKESN